MDILSTDIDLHFVRALQVGDESALTELIRKYEEPLFRLIYRYVGVEETARDLLQETFVRMYFQINRFKPQAKFVTWLYAVATNLCHDHARSKRGRQSALTDSLDNPGSHQELTAANSNPAEIAESRERVAALEDAIARLPHHLKLALVLFSIEGHSPQECAKMLGITSKAVETRVYRARKILEKELRQQGKSALTSFNS